MSGRRGYVDVKGLEEEEHAAARPCLEREEDAITSALVWLPLPHMVHPAMPRRHPRSTCGCWIEDAPPLPPT